MRGWILLGLLGVSVGAGALSSAWLWLASCLLIWVAAALYPSDLRGPRGLGAWSLWAFWGGLCAGLSGEPWLAAGAWSRQLTGVLVLWLAHSWWGRPHRRAWLGGLWAIGVAWSLRCAWSGHWEPQAVALAAAGLGACLGSFRGDLPPAVRRVMGALIAALGAAVLIGSSSGRGPAAAGIFAAWSRAAAVAAAAPRSGLGPGLFQRGERRPAPPGSVEARVAGDFVASVPEWLRAAAETGPIGAALLLLAVLRTGLRPRAGFQLAPREWERCAASGAFWALAAYAILGSLLSAGGVWALWFSAAACAAPGPEEEETSVVPLRPVFAWAGAAGCLLLAIPGLWVMRGPSGLRQLEAAVRIAPQDSGLLQALAMEHLRARPPRWTQALWRLRQAGQYSRDPRARLKTAEIYRALGVRPPEPGGDGF